MTYVEVVEELKAAHGCDNGSFGGFGEWNRRHAFGHDEPLRCRGDLKVAAIDSKSRNEREPSIVGQPWYRQHGPVRLERYLVGGHLRREGIERLVGRGMAVRLKG